MSRGHQACTAVVRCHASTDAGLTACAAGDCITAAAAQPVAPRVCHLLCCGLCRQACLRAVCTHPRSSRQRCLCIHLLLMRPRRAAGDRQAHTASRGRKHQMAWKTELSQNAALKQAPRYATLRCALRTLNPEFAHRSRSPGRRSQFCPSCRGAGPSSPVPPAAAWAPPAAVAAAGPSATDVME